MKQLFISFSFLIILLTGALPIFAQDSSTTLTVASVEIFKSRCNGGTECLNGIQACLNQYATLNSAQGVYNVQSSSELTPCINKALSTAPASRPVTYCTEEQVTHNAYYSC